MPNALQINLTDDLLLFVRGKVSKGEFASESDVIEESVRAMQDNEIAIEEWIREKVLPVHDRIMADPSECIPIEEVEQNLEVSRRQRSRSVGPQSR